MAAETVGADGEEGEEVFVDSCAPADHWAGQGRRRVGVEGMRQMPSQEATKTHDECGFGGASRWREGGGGVPPFQWP